MFRIITIFILQILICHHMAWAVDVQSNSVVNEKKEAKPIDPIIQKFLSKPKSPFSSWIPKPPPPPPEKKAEPVADNKVRVVVPPPPPPERISRAALKINLNGLVWGGDTPQAIINDRVVKVGDTIEEMKIESITQKGVGILYTGSKYRGQRIVLTVD